MVTIADHLIHGDHYDLYLMVIHVWQPPPHPNALYAYYLGACDYLGQYL